MDANGQRFWMLCSSLHWYIEDGLEYNQEHGSLRLASRQAMPAWQEDQAAAALRLETVPQTMDRFQTRAYVEDDGSIWATTEGEEPIPLFDPPAGGKVTSLAMGFDGVLYMAIDGAVVMLDRLDRWSPKTLSKGGFEAWRLAANPAGGVWAVDRDNGKLGQVRGLPLREKPSAGFASDTVRPCQENPNPPVLIEVDTAVWPGVETIAAIDCSPAGKLALLTWSAAGGRLRVLQSDGTFAPPLTLQGSQFPYSLAWLSEDLVAVMLAGKDQPMKEAPVYPTAPQSFPAAPVGHFYPLLDATGDPFAHTLTLPPEYPSAAGVSPLFPLSKPSFAASGLAVNRRPGDGGPAGLVDGGSTQTVWHRLYLEAFIPPHCGITVKLAATDVPLPPEDKPLAPGETPQWFVHSFGERFANTADGTPRGVWSPLRSEVPFHPGILPCPQEKDRSGLFTVLIQRTGLAVSSLRGRYLWLRVELTGDGRSTPELAAVRAYGSRFSYLNQYLPTLYRETVFEPEADLKGTATASDFLERFLDNFEGVLTPLEDRIASSYLLTVPATVPDDSLEWLGGWIGVAFDPAYPSDRRRALLKATPTLSVSRGTLRGLQLALDVATGGLVTSRDVLPVEEFRLRRTFATILGADLADEDDPLLAGIVQSGNSYVGDTLFLGDDTHQEFLALFRPDATITAGEEEAVEEFLLRLANRLTVLVHKDVSDDDFKLVRRVVDLETPAHVVTRVVRASQALLVGIASLVGIDTRPVPHHDPYPVRVDRSQLSGGDLLTRPPALDYRLEGGTSGSHAPQAVIDAPAFVDFGANFTLRAGGSTPAPGKTIAKFSWERKE